LLVANGAVFPLLNSYPASMMNLKQNLVWFIDNKMLKFYNCSYQNAQNDRFHALMGIAWLLHLPASKCTSTHSLRDA